MERLNKIMKEQVYCDNTGNTYKVQQAWNKKYIVMRYNTGRYGSIFKAIAPQRNKANIYKDLSKFAKDNNWKEYTRKIK